MDEDKVLSPGEIADLERELAENPAMGEPASDFQEEIDLSQVNPAELPAINSEQLQQQIDDYKEYGGRPIEAALGAAGSAATFGVSDVILRGAGVSADRINKVREESPTAETIGTVGGIVGPIVLSGGTSLAAKAISAPFKAVTKLGSAAEIAAVKALAPKASQLAAEEVTKQASRQIIGGMAARGAAEGAAIGAGQLASDIALEKKDLSAESVLATVGTGITTGTAFGGLLGGLQAGVPLGKKAVGVGKEKLTGAVETLAPKVLDKVSNTAKALAKTGNKAADLTERLGADAQHLPDFVANDLKYGYTDTASSLSTKNKEVLKQTGKELDSIAQTIDAEIKAKGSQIVTRDEAYNPILNKIAEERSKLKVGVHEEELAALNKLENIVKADMEGVGAKIKTGRIDAKTLNQLDEVESATNAAINETDRVLSRTDDVLAIDRRRAQLEQQLDGLAEKRNRAEEALRGRFISDKQAKIYKQRVADYSARQSVLATELKNISGAAEERFAALARKSQLQAQLDAIAKARREGVIRDTPLQFKDYNNLRKKLQGYTWRYDGSKVENLVADYANDLRAVMRKETDRIAGKIDETMPGLSEQLKNANRRYHIAGVVSKYVDDMAHTAPDILSHYELIGTAAKRLMRNAATMEFIGKGVVNLSSNIGKSVGQFFSTKPITGKMSFPASTVLLRTALAVNDKNEPPKNKEQAFNNISKNVNKLVSDQEELANYLAKKSAAISDASPEIGQALQQRMVTAVAFLNSKLPKSAVQQGILGRKWQPSSMELAKFERYFQVVDQPLSVLEELKQGTLTREHVEALQVVYPEIYKEIQRQVTDTITQSGQDLSYPKKLQLGILLNVPADSSLQPQTVMQLQQSIATQPEQPQPGPNFSPSAMGQTGLSERAQSGTEKLTNR